MQFAEPAPDWEALLARHRAELEAQLRASDLPVVGLAEPAPDPRMLGDTMAVNGVMQGVGLSYGDPMRSQGPLVQVRTARDEPLTDLHDAIEEEQDRVGDESPIDEEPTAGTLVIDGEPCAAEILQAAPRFWAGRFTHRGAQVVVVARDWDLATARLASVTDVGPYVQGSHDYLARMRVEAAPQPRPEPADAVSYTHLTLPTIYSV